MLSKHAEAAASGRQTARFAFETRQVEVVNVDGGINHDRTVRSFSNILDSDAAERPPQSAHVTWPNEAAERGSRASPCSRQVPLLLGRRHDPNPDRRAHAPQDGGRGVIDSF